MKVVLESSRNNVIIKNLVLRQYEIQQQIL